MEFAQNAQVVKEFSLKKKKKQVFSEALSQLYAKKNVNQSTNIISLLF